MCGIVCAFDLKQKADILRPKVLEMSKIIRHRGPDWSGIFSNEKSIKMNLIVDYLGGSFKKEYSNSSPMQYGCTNLGIAPSFELHEQGWIVNIGASLFYKLDTKNKNNQFLIYPKINALYHVVDDLMLFYAGAEGNLKQNTYSDFVNENPFLSPTLNILPTDKQYDFFAGLKGKIVNNVSYVNQGLKY